MTLKVSGLRTVLGVLGILAILSALLPGAREVNALCVRLLLHLKGNTFVQGQPGGCLIYIIPNVQFTEPCKQELRARSALSPDDFVLANCTGGYSKIAPPPAAAWKGHPLLTATALRLASLASQQLPPSNSTNPPAEMREPYAHLESTREIVSLAQSSDPENGALWLAQAVIELGSGRQEAAMQSLRLAASKSNWNATAQASFNYIAPVFERAGLSKLDAAIEASRWSPCFWVSPLQRAVYRDLTDQMTRAVQAGTDPEVSSLTSLLVELRRPNWRDRQLWNGFRRDPPADGLVEAMARSMGRTLPPEPKEYDLSLSEERKKLRQQLLDDYLKLHAESNLVTTFLEQRAAGQSDRAALRQQTIQQNRAVMLAGLQSNLAGALAPMTLSCLLVAALLGAPLAWGRRTGAAATELWQRREFWMLSTLVIIAGAAVLTNALLAIGIFNQVGLTLSEPSPALSPTTKALLVSFTLCGLWFALLLCCWRSRSKLPRSGYIILFLAGAYLVCTLTAGYFRAQLLRQIAAGLF